MALELPPEVWDGIINMYLSIYDFHDEQPQLRSMRLVNKTFNHIISTILYHTIEINIDEDYSLAKLEWMTTRSHLAICVREYQCQFMETGYHTGASTSLTYPLEQACDNYTYDPAKSQSRNSQLAFMSTTQLYHEQIDYLMQLPNLHMLAVRTWGRSLSHVLRRDLPRGLRVFHALGVMAFRAMLQTAYRKTLSDVGQRHITSLTVEGISPQCLILQDKELDQACIGYSHDYESPDTAWLYILGRIVRAADKLQHFSLKVVDPDTDFREPKIYLDMLLCTRITAKLGTAGPVKHFPYLTELRLVDITAPKDVITSLLVGHKSSLRYLKFDGFVIRYDMEDKDRQPWRTIWQAFQTAEPTELFLSTVRLDRLSWGMDEHTHMHPEEADIWMARLSGKIRDELDVDVFPRGRFQCDNCVDDLSENDPDDDNYNDEDHEIAQEMWEDIKSNEDGDR